MCHPHNRVEKMKLLKSFLSLSLVSLFLLGGVASSEPEPRATPWPAQFHSSLLINNSVGKLQINELWYDWPNRRNANIIHYQLKGVLYDVEWDNGTSYYYTSKQCTTMHFPVGILRPNFLDGANYLGQVHKDGFLCNLWEKVDFIWYYEDVVTNRPVSWTFYTGMTVQVMNFQVGKVLEEAEWQAPAYCFDDEENKAKVENEDDESAFGFSSLMRDIHARSSLLVS